MCHLVREAGDARGRWKGFSPDRVDALVWALTDLLLAPMASEGLYEVYRRLSDQAQAGRSEDGSASMGKEHDR
jgi:hypothetical protein